MASNETRSKSLTIIKYEIIEDKVEKLYTVFYKICLAFKVFTFVYLHEDRQVTIYANPRVALSIVSPLFYGGIHNNRQLSANIKRKKS